MKKRITLVVEYDGDSTPEEVAVYLKYVIKNHETATSHGKCVPTNTGTAYLNDYEVIGIAH